MPFSPSSHLISFGWEGPGSGLRNGSLSKPVTVAHKTDLKGLGKDRDTGYAWWEDVFSAVASRASTGTVTDIRRTSTGIYSSRPSGSLSPSVSSNVTAPSTIALLDPSNSLSNSGGSFHNDTIAHAKLEAARREFYSKFFRGRPLESTTDGMVKSDPVPSTSKLSLLMTSSTDKKPKKSKDKHSSKERSSTPRADMDIALLPDSNGTSKAKKTPEERAAKAALKAHKKAGLTEDKKLDKKERQQRRLDKQAEKEAKALANMMDEQDPTGTVGELSNEAVSETLNLDNSNHMKTSDPVPVISKLSNPIVSETGVVSRKEPTKDRSTALEADPEDATLPEPSSATKTAEKTPEEPAAKAALKAQKRAELAKYKKLPKKERKQIRLDKKAEKETRALAKMMDDQDPSGTVGEVTEEAVSKKLTHKRKRSEEDGDGTQVKVSNAGTPNKSKAQKRAEKRAERRAEKKERKRIKLECRMSKRKLKKSQLSPQKDGRAGKDPTNEMVTRSKKRKRENENENEE